MNVIGIALILDSSHAARNAVVQLDHVKFTKVVRNLVSNAIKFTPSRGNIIITISLVERTHRKLSHPFVLRPQLVPFEKCMVIAVKDSGVGISTENIAKLFKSVVQVFEIF